MANSELRLIKNALEFIPKERISEVPKNVRGIYALYKESKDKRNYDLVYIGMARGQNSGIKARLKSHKRRKKDLWTHFSAFEVWDNIGKAEIEELEGLFRHLFRKDSKANSLNRQKGYKKLGGIRGRTVTVRYTTKRGKTHG